MKKILLPATMVAFIALGIGCKGNSSDTTTDSSSSARVDTMSGTTTDQPKMSGSATDTMHNMAADSSKKDDKDFVLEAASGGMMEVELGSISQTNAASSKVKMFGKMMVNDHSKANAELKSIASKNNIALPTIPQEKHKMHIDDLKSKKGADFDKAYVDMMVDDHKEDISKFEDEANNGKNAEVKAFASKTLPVLKKHLESILAVQAGMK